MAISVRVSAADLWHRLTQPGYLKLCHPFCASTEVERWPGEGARDSITYYSGRRYRRHFVRWIEGEGYDIELGDAPNQTARVSWRIMPQGDAQCRLTIEVVPLFPDDMPEARRQMILEREFGADLAHYLDGVVQGIRHWVETGTPVAEDQFGWNPLYSRPKAS
ncbi:SRPBCC family protein [Minwuia sp.]|uniref:SRPBCC family protein n=1 Tax=Minwuia sp. TaxID=2493630 RepID=UPI003A8EA9B6